MRCAKDAAAMKIVLLAMLFGIILLMAHFDGPARLVACRQRYADAAIAAVQPRHAAPSLEYFQTRCTRSQLRPKFASRA